jgi:hypothetical protein
VDRTKFGPQSSAFLTKFGWTNSPLSGPCFVPALAGIRRLAARIKAIALVQLLMKRELNLKLSGKEVHYAT